MKHTVKLIEKPGRYMLEKTPRYDVSLNGEVVDELYFNMTGYVGGLPTVQGSVMNIGEKPISAWRKEAAAINREAAQAIAALSDDPRKISGPGSVRPTEDARYALVVSSVRGDAYQADVVPRRALIKAFENAGGNPVGLGFFGGVEVSDPPKAVLFPGDAWIGEILGEGRFVTADGEDRDLHAARIESVRDSDDPDLVVVTGTPMISEDEVSVTATRESVSFAQRFLGRYATLGDVERVDDTEPAASPSP